MIGTVLDNRYRLERVIGEGGMGAVYEATHTGTGKRVAVKLIQQMALGDTDVWSRFQREARASSTIDTRHIVEVIDSGRDPETGLPYMAMELLKGEDLGAVLARRGGLEPTLAVRLLSQACVGLSKAHRAFVVHRDIKPANLFLTEEDEGGEVIVKLLDFGIAKVRPPTPIESDGLHLTQTGKLLGTPLYMSPEQAQGAKDIDARSDIWSLGAVLYETLTGRSPFQHADNLGKLILAICSKPPQPPGELAPVPPELEAIVMRCLVIDREARYATADDLLADLLALAPEGTRVACAEIWDGSGLPTLRATNPGLRDASPSRPDRVKVRPPRAADDDTHAVEDPGVASTLYASAHTASQGRPSTRARMALVAAGVLGLGGGALAVWTGGLTGDHDRAQPALRPPDATATAAPSVTGAASAAPTATVQIFPPDATVHVNGKPTAVTSGSVEVCADVDAELVLTITKGSQSQKHIVTMTKDGPRPDRITLEQAPAASAAPAAEARPGALPPTSARPSQPGPAAKPLPAAPAPTAIPYAPKFDD